LINAKLKHKQHILTHIVIVNGYGKDTTSRFVDDTETIAFALDDIDDSPRNFWSSVETADTIDSTRISDRNGTSSDVAVEEWKGGLLPPVTNLNDL